MALYFGGDVFRTVHEGTAMSVISDVADGIGSFVKVATNFAEIVEKNVDSYYKMKDKIIARQQLDSIERVLHLFPQIWLFNGLFAASFLKDVRTADNSARNRDGPTIEH